MISTMLLMMSMSGAAASLHAGANASQSDGHCAREVDAQRTRQCGTPITKASAQPDDGVEVAVRRIYDLRDLAAMLPTTESLDEVTRTVWDELVSAYWVPLQPGVYVSDAEPSKHEQAEEAFEMLRTLYGESYSVRLECVQVYRDVDVRLGGGRPETDEPHPAALVEQMVRRRSAASISATERIQYIADWQPIVSNNAVGYDPDIRTMEHGLVGSMLIGAGPDQGGRVSVRFTGSISQGGVQESMVEAPGASVVSGLPLGLERRAERVFDLRGAVPLGRATVIGVLDGFEPDLQLVVLIEVRGAE
ncbi:MAG: hypothetical protein R3B68_12030 [Phycisphaerales bacterium]